jgi:hypothetical protein
MHAGRGVPRLGMGSSSWAGSEKRTAAMSDTPMNLLGRAKSAGVRGRVESSEGTGTS